ncbi:MAG: DUF1353 domain-containing protein [Cellvibrionaceae bacterium]|nr:DUF1353 domain-containing protein [Cellvibrionaceae bacterium]
MAPPKLEYLPAHDRWRLLAPLVTPEYTIPAGFESDGASVPRPFWPIIPRVGKYLTASIVHDWMYVNAIGTKREADRLFKLNMQRAGVSRWRVWLMYLSVKTFGRGSY